jgi:hypothetical protein
VASPRPARPVLGLFDRLFDCKWIAKRRGPLVQRQDFGTGHEFRPILVTDHIVGTIIIPRDLADVDWGISEVSLQSGTQFPALVGEALSLTRGLLVPQLV